MRPPAECQTMPELRAEIDRLDRELVSLLVARAGCIDRAIELKAEAGLPARIASRVEQVLENIRARSLREGLDPGLAEDLWGRIIEWSIAREARVLGPESRGGTR